MSVGKWGWRGCWAWVVVTERSLTIVVRDIIVVIFIIIIIVESVITANVIGRGGLISSRGLSGPEVIVALLVEYFTHEPHFLLLLLCAYVHARLKE